MLERNKNFYDNTKNLGQIFTQQNIVKFMLNLVKNSNNFEVYVNYKISFV